MPSAAALSASVAFRPPILPTAPLKVPISLLHFNPFKHPFVPSQSLSVKLHVFGKGPEVFVSVLIFFKVLNCTVSRKKSSLLSSEAGGWVRYSEFLMYFILQVLGGSLRSNSSLKPGFPGGIQV